MELDELLACRLDSGHRKVEPCTVVIFGASGDLTARKLIPALYHLHSGKQLPVPFRVLGFARREKADEVWRTELKIALENYSRTKRAEAATWEAFAAGIAYCQGDISDPAAYLRLKKRIDAGDLRLSENLLFYLAVSPSQFAEVVERLHEVGLLRKDGSGPGWQRVVVEKPFGKDFDSARQLNAALIQFIHERQVFRIDHYLGKETVQNILMFRFSNSVFEQIWNRQLVDHVQITVSETLGVGSRGGFYEEAGALRDIVQNHLLQVLALVAMEPPVSLEAEAIRDEKVKLLKSVRLLLPSQVAANVVRGQYTEGPNGMVAYRQEPKVRPGSNVETYVALRLFIDNWRWAGVPFYLRSGKRLALGASEVRVQFRPTPNVLFAAQCGPKLDANAITLRLQPNEGITLRFNGKVPGPTTEIRPVRMHFSYNTEFGAYTPEAYERLLLEAMAGDATLFIRRDEVEAAWTIVDPIREAWDDHPFSETEFYPAGSWGPVAADQLLSVRDHAWRNPQPVE
ncbi:MAG: glucose-6-phosphate dehydrogenase [Verrucomicrobia bacterium]|nr:glucose-6-phosphate dehydrogenase [Verrucomicrobiota bacterium]